MIASFPLPAVVIDLETSGANVSYDRIIEVGIVEIDNDGSIREWSTLVNPGRPIPSFIEELTGITNNALANAPKFEQVAKEILLRIQGKLFIAHNARFDYGFIRNEFSRLAYSFSTKTLCSLKLSRQLYPGETSHGLQAIIQRHRIEVAKRHRAMDDARATYQFLLIAEAQHGPEPIRTVLNRELKRSSVPVGLSDAIVKELPQAPGVYYFWGENTELLYVGKAINIRKRVLSHFSADHKASREMRMCQQITKVTWDVTAGELSALILESCKIKQLKPLFNRKLRRAKGLYTIQLKENEQGWLTPFIYPLDTTIGADHSYGLFPSAMKAKETLRSISDKLSLCYYACCLERTSSRPCSRYQLKKCSGLCTGTVSVTTHNQYMRDGMREFALKVWPYTGPIALNETLAGGRSDLSLIVDQWRVLGVGRIKDNEAIIIERHEGPLDRDVYHYLVNALLGDHEKNKIRKLENVIYMQ